MMMNQVWDVQVLSGARGVEPQKNVRFGVRRVQVSRDGLSDVSVPLIYSMVGVRTIDAGIAIETYDEGGHADQIRDMDIVSHVEFTAWGNIRVTGMERTADGALVFAVWEVSPSAEG